MDLLAINIHGSIVRIADLLRELDGKYQFTSGEVRMLERAISTSYILVEKLEKRSKIERGRK